MSSRSFNGEMRKLAVGLSWAEVLKVRSAQTIKLIDEFYVDNQETWKVLARQFGYKKWKSFWEFVRSHRNPDFLDNETPESEGKQGDEGGSQNSDPPKRSKVSDKEILEAAASGLGRNAIVEKLHVQPQRVTILIRAKKLDYDLLLSAPIINGLPEAAPEADNTPKIDWEAKYNTLKMENAIIKLKLREKRNKEWFSDGDSCYGVLQINPMASLEVAAAAHRTLARQYHADLNGGSNEEMKRLNRAFDEYAALQALSPDYRIMAMSSKWRNKSGRV